MKIQVLKNSIANCTKCKLGLQSDPHGPVLYRGNIDSYWAIYGEALGKVEVVENKPFCGPAGKQLDKMIQYLDLEEKYYPYISNVIKCRPIAPKGSGKENLKPTEIDPDAWNICKQYTQQEFSILTNIKLVVLAGDVATKAFLPELKRSTFTSLVGKLQFTIEWPDKVFVPIFHPAFLLRKRNNPETYKPYQEKTKECLDIIKRIVTNL